jgi:hypothetical protein
LYLREASVSASLWASESDNLLSFCLPSGKPALKRKPLDDSIARSLSEVSIRVAKEQIKCLCSEEQVQIY